MAEMLIPADLQKEYKTKFVPAKVTGDGYWTWPEGLFTDQVHTFGLKNLKEIWAAKDQIKFNGKVST